MLALQVVVLAPRDPGDHSVRHALTGISNCEGVVEITNSRSRADCSEQFGRGLWLPCVEHEGLDRAAAATALGLEARERVGGRRPTAD